jgi:cytochrome c5
MLYRAVLLVMLAACGESLPRHALVVNESSATPQLRESCAFTEQKCTRCHTIGRVLAWDAHTRADWEPLVTRMRQMASSGITKADAEVVLSCLESRDPPQKAER